MKTDFFEALEQNRYIRNFQNDTKLIISSVLIALIWSIVYVMFFYVPTYESNAKIWIKDSSTDEFVSSLGVESPLKSLTSAGNPLLTQIELLKSDRMKKTIVDYKSSQGAKIKTKDVKIHVKSMPNTDILKISITDISPLKAQKTLEVLLKEYENINLLINRKISTTRRKYIEIKLQEINNELLKIREKIKIYKSDNLAININEESSRLVAQKTLMNAKRETVLADIKKTESLVKELENQLSLNAKDAIDAVAIGAGNPVLVKLRNKLNEAIQKYNEDSSILAETNPKMVAQKNKIEVINDQIKKQLELSLGEYSGDKKINISDPVRINLVDKLANSKTNLMGFYAEKKALKATIGRINIQQSKIPEKKFVLDSLEQEERVLSIAYNQLKEKQIEARIKEAEVASNVIIVDPPDVPLSKSFPSDKHTLILGALLGLLLGLSSSLIKTLLEDACDDSDLIEKVTKAPVIGSIPWIENYTQCAEIEYNTINKLTYDNLVSNLIIKCYKNNSNVLTFTSSSLKKPQSSVVYRLAKNLKKSSHSVLVIDSDFRIPTIAKSANIDDILKGNLSDLIMYTEKKLQQNNTIKKEDVMSALTTDEQGIKHLGNKDIVFEPYEFFGTASFKSIINILKNEFDWVLIDAGAPQVTPEFLIISKLSDGVVLFADKTITYSTLKNIAKTLQNANIPFIGTIMRGSDQKLKKEYKEYLKLQKDKMINSESDKVNKSYTGNNSID